MDGVVTSVQRKVNVLQGEGDDLLQKLEEVHKECSFSSGMVEKLIKQFAKYGEEYQLPKVDDDDFKLDVVGDVPMHDMLRNNVIELRALLAKKRELQKVQDEMGGRL